MLAMNSLILVPLTLGIVVLVSIATGVAVMFGYHPVWDLFIETLIPPEQHPLAFRNVHNLFLLLSAWLAAVWLQLMLGYTDLPLSRQGVFLVVLACIWFLLGRELSRLPGVVGWHVISAGWLLWLIGLLQVFFSPAEATVTVILGLVISGEFLYRSRAVYWIPVDCHDTCINSSYNKNPGKKCNVLPGFDGHYFCFCYPVTRYDGQ